MKISKKMQDIINDQIKHEFDAAYLYLSMAAYFEGNNLLGFAAWMKKQAMEETEHAMKLYGYIHERQGKVTLKALEQPKSEWNDALSAFSDAYAHELKVTGLIHGIADAAAQEKDHATSSFIKWFIDEQVEEESNADAIVEKLKLAGSNVGALMMIDRELSQRK
jgi:ferritin